MKNPTFRYPCDQQTLDTAIRERDEARAEVERLRKRVQAAHRRAQKAESRVCRVSRLYDKWKGNAEFWHRNFLEHHGIKLKPAALTETVNPVSSTQPEIFEAHGLEWYRHTPGDKMPCDGQTITQCLLRKELTGKYWESKSPACGWNWQKMPGVKTWEIIGWRPADAPEKLPRK